MPSRVPKRQSASPQTQQNSWDARDGSVQCSSHFEKLARERGFRALAGLDEVGRGALFGPVFASAVILHPECLLKGLQDSKLLAAERRQILAEQIKREALAWAVGAADAFEIDQVNIYQASRLAMKRAVESLTLKPDFLLIDAVSVDLPIHQESLIKGDARCRSIAAASIVAKVARDECMDHWQTVFPQYQLSSNKGYSTPDHRRALKEHGPTFLHRFSFAPVRLNCSETWWTGYQSLSAGNRL